MRTPASAVALPIVLCLLNAAPTLHTAQNVARSHADNDRDHYHAMLVAFRSGTDSVIDEVVAWDHRRLKAAIGRIDAPGDPNRPWSFDFLRAAAMLQIAAALRCMDGAGGTEDTLFHFEMAAGHLRHAGTGVQPFASRTFYALSRLLRTRGRISEAFRLLQTARGVFPGDPLILYESGHLDEMLATQWQSAPGAAARTGTASSFSHTDSLDSVTAHRANRLKDAEKWLRQSVAGDPSNVMARLHFGRVLMMRRSDDESLQILAGVRGAGDAATRYLALMFMGAVHARADRLEAAARTYREAIETFPGSHTAYVALSEALQGIGRAEEARGVLRQLLTEAPDARREPWSWYFVEPPDLARERVEALFLEGRR